MTLPEDHLGRVTALSLRERIAQLIFVRIGSNMPPIRSAEEDEQRVARLIQGCPVGGLLLFNGGPQARETLSRLQQASQVPLLVAADIERGVGQQVRGYTLFPHAMAFEKLGCDAPLAVVQFATATAQEARDVGIHISFSPVADVNTNPNNPIIATRAFSENASRAAALAAAYVRAAEQAGLRTTAKHFPGHGNTEQDSHDSLPSVQRSLDELEKCELVPFRAAVEGGCSLVMTAHVAFPTIDASGRPATLSKIILQNILRERLGFGGVICSDSLLMAGVRERFATEEEMVAAVLAAGVDLLLDIADPAKVTRYLCDCVEQGTIDIRRIDQAFERVWALKQRCFADTARDTGQAEPSSHASPAELAATIARGAIQVSGGAENTLPLDAETPLVAILLKAFETPIEPLEQPLAAALRQRFNDVKYVQLGPRADAAAMEAAYVAACNAPQLLVAVIVRPAAWYAFGLLPEQKAFVERLIQVRKVVLASLGVPYALREFPNAAARVCTYSDVPVSQQALAEFL
jgi:beta-glucosidase-like glycosyl hydrolase